MKKNVNRRDFFKTAMTVFAGSLVLPSLFKNLPEAQAEQKRKSKEAASLDVISETNPVAVNLKYTTNHATIKDATLKTERQGVKFENQFCKDCQFYQIKEEGTDKNEKVAPCQLMINPTTSKSYFVKSKGWCNSWAKRA